MDDLYKYPRTHHLPWSPGATDDDKVLGDIDMWFGRDIVVTEKMDGECTTMYPGHYHARSLDSANHESRNYVKGLWGTIRHEIPAGWRICGENLYARHSIGYDELDSYFMVFSIWNEKNICLSWDETVAYSIILGLTPVRELFRGKFDVGFLRDFHEGLDLDRQEGFVVRSAGEFHYDDFQDNVAKWVRRNHVQSSQHWMLEKITPNKLKQIESHEKTIEGRGGGDPTEVAPPG